MAKSVSNVISHLFGGKFSEFKKRSERAFTCLYDDKNPDFKRNDFHVLVDVYFYEGTADWKGNTATSLSVKVYLGIKKAMGCTGNTEKAYYFACLFHDSPDFKDAETRFTLTEPTDWFDNRLDMYFILPTDTFACLSVDVQKPFVNEREIASYIDKVVGYMFKREHYEKAMELMYSLGRFHFKNY